MIVRAGKIVMSLEKPRRRGFGKGQGEQGRLSVHQRKVPSHGQGDIVFKPRGKSVSIIQIAIENVVVNVTEDAPRLVYFLGLAGNGDALNLAVFIKIGVADLHDLVVEKGAERIGTARIEGYADGAKPRIPIKATG